MMGAVFTSGATSVTLSKFPDLRGTLARSRGEDVIVTDAGVRRVFNRRIPSRRISAEFKMCNQNDRRLLEQFFWETVKGRQSLFDFETKTQTADLLQVGATIGGLPIVVGTPLPSSCWFPGGGLLQVGQWIVPDSYIFSDVRFDMAALAWVDEGPDNSSVMLSMVQELAP